MRDSFGQLVVASLLAFVGACDPAPGAAPVAGASGGMAPLSGSGGAAMVWSAGRNGGAGMGGAGGGACERVVRFTAAPLAEPPPFDVIIVADHSASLSWSREDLAAGLRTLLSDVHGYSARFFVLTPTQYGASSAGAVNQLNGLPLVPWADPVTGAAYTDAMTDYSQTCAAADGSAIECPAYDPTSKLEYELNGSFQFVMPQPVAAIDKDSTDAEIAAQQDAISAAITNLGGLGSPREQPLCTLNRYVLQDAAALPRRAVFVILSDEDDVSRPDECLIGYEFGKSTTLSSTGETCDHDCDTYRYYASRRVPVQSLEFSCVPVDDLGNAHPEQGVMTSASVIPPAGCVIETTGACDQAALDVAATQCRDAAIVADCEAHCLEANSFGCSLETTAEAPDYCTSAFTELGVAYTNFYDYCNRTVGDQGWSGCQRGGYLAGQAPIFTTRTIPIVQGQTSDILAMNFEREAAQVFGPDGFRVEVIGFDLGSDCVPGQGQSFATGLKMLATDGVVVPICGDYAPALDGVRQFALRLLQTELMLDLKASETVSSVRVSDEQGRERVLPATSYRYDRPAKLLRIDAAAVALSDVSLSVEVEDACVGSVD